MDRPLPLRHPRLPGLSRADFIVAPGNAVALSLVEGWRDWPAGKLMLTGPEGSGKTHLAHVWADAAGARIRPARGLTAEEVPALATGPLALEDLHRIDGPGTEAALFHLHNLMRAEGQPLLLTGLGRVQDWPVALPDLRSRLQGTQAVQLDRPDDALLEAVLVKLFAERQLGVPAPVIDYLLKRMDRSFAAARQIVGRLDAASLAERRAITVRLARDILDKLPDETS